MRQRPTAAFADTVRARAGAAINDADWDAQWRAWRQDAHREMQRHAMHLASNRPVRGRPRLRDAEGGTRTLDAANGEVTFVAFWSRYCTPSFVQLAQLSRLGTRCSSRACASSLSRKKSRRKP